MSSFGAFPSTSAFARDAAEHTAREQRTLFPDKANQTVDELIEAQRKEAARKEAGPPIEHWHHDLGTLDILLEERHPDIERARDLIREIQREMDRWAR